MASVGPKVRAGDGTIDTEPDEAATRERIDALGRTLVVAPHPDDETLGCGGLLALLARVHAAVLVVLVSDGAASHPQSVSHPPALMRRLRQREMLDALRVLGLGNERLWTLGLPDGAVPFPDDLAFEANVDRLSRRLDEFKPDTLVLPWRHDDHPDHRASHAIASAARARAAPGARRLEYVVWSTGPGPSERHPEAETWTFAIDPVVDLKCRALEAHRSQLGQVIRDDPGGFVIPAALVARCSKRTETYVDTTDWSP